MIVPVCLNQTLQTENGGLKRLQQHKGRAQTVKRLSRYLKFQLKPLWTDGVLLLNAS